MFQKMLHLCAVKLCVLFQNASLCLGAMSITTERESAVDFAKPYMQKTFGILIEKPEPKSSVFQFLWPLASEVWLITSAAVVFVGILLYVMDFFSPNFTEEEEEDVVAAEASGPIVERFTLRETLWFTYGSLVGAETVVMPKTFSARLLSGAWWFFSLILIASYTANLAAFLTVTKIETPIKSVADLAAQTKIKYGTIKNTYAHSMFRSSNMEMIQKMWSFMSQIYADAMVDNTSVGVQKVKEGGYAFIFDTPIVKYISMQECDTMVVGDSFDEKGLGIGVPIGAAYRDHISIALLSLNENGRTQGYYDR